MKRTMDTMLFSWLFICLIHFTSTKVLGQEPDEKLASKYGLTILPPDDELQPAPEWFQNADMFTSSRSVWKGHQFILKDTVMTRILRVRAGNTPLPITEHYPVEKMNSLDGEIIKGVSLISHVPHCKKAFEEAQDKGFKAIPYVHFRCVHTNFADQDVFYFEHPEILVKDRDGKWVHIPMDGSD